MSTVTTTPARTVVRDAINRMTGNGREKHRGGIEYSREMVTPAKAEKWLGRNKRNRKLRTRDVAKYATDMRNGHWVENGETIKFDTDGDLADGQHRLHAVIDSGASVWMNVARGIEPEAFATLDRGAKRSAGDYLYLLGEKDTTNLAVAVAHVRRAERGDQWGMGLRYVVTPAEVGETLEKHPGIRDSLRRAHNKTVGWVGLLAFLHYSFARKDAAAADWFLDALKGGEGLGASDAVYRLREMLLDARRPGRRMDWVTAMKAIITAWNKHRAGERCRILRVPDGFPEIE